MGMEFNRRYWITLSVFGVIALLLLWGEHKVHILGALPWLILLICPLMHIFMHGGHGTHQHAQQKDDDRE
jgi:Na+/glutamate symporter